jgi:acetyl esterase/lipase
MWSHGGGFRAGDRPWVLRAAGGTGLFDAITAAGLALATVDYRLAGEASWPAQREDVALALDFLAERPEIDADRIGTWGESAGGHLALTAAVTDARVKAAVAWYPLTDIAALDRETGGLPESLWLGGVPAEMPERMVDASPITFVTADSPPCLLIHGDSDTVYPLSQSQRFHQRLRESDVDSTLRVVPADHGFAGYDDVPGLVRDSIRFLVERLSGRRSPA